MLAEQWSSMVWPASKSAVNDPETGATRDTLVQVGKASVSIPNGFVSITA